MKKLVISEFYKTIYSKKNKVLFILAMAMYAVLALFTLFYGQGFYDNNNIIKINSLNFPAFLMREYHFIFIFVIILTLAVDSLSWEKISGIYRLYMIRAYTKKELIISKIVFISILALLVTMVIFILSTIIGWLFAIKVNTTDFIHMNKQFNIIQSIVYNLKFFLCEWIITLGIIGITSIVSVFSHNAIITYLCSIGIAIGSIYVYDKLEFFFVSSKIIFDTLGGIDKSFLFIAPTLAIITIVLSIVLFNIKDYKY